MKMLLVCHGNICRSPMAEFVMKDLLNKAGRTDVTVESASLHTDEIGNDIHWGTRRMLGINIKIGHVLHVRMKPALTIDFVYPSPAISVCGRKRGRFGVY
ncbi:MAG: hypothetical protein IJR99_03530 [Kiritimatiellae bacterium]|nr:hypothetical protein [Kiritimatiellia bacterium]